MTYIPKFPMERDKVVSDKEKVLAKWPDAYCYKSFCEFRIYKGPKAVVSRGYGLSAKSAWADAARRLEDGK